MSEFFGYLTIGVVTGSIYALIATGLVVTYTTTGIFNFAHGAVAMISAFIFWQLWQGWHINVWVSLILMLVVIAPLIGAIIEFALMRPIQGRPVDVAVVVTLGLLLALVGLANLVWDPQTPRSLPQFFEGRGFAVGGQIISYEQLGAALLLVGSVLGLRVLFRQTRVGIALRAVVDSPDLLAMAGGRPNRTKQLAWAMSCSLAGAAGIVLAATHQLNIFNLTLYVVEGYAAAIIGRLRNLPITIGGALAIAIGQQVAQGYLPTSGFISKSRDIIPVAILFIALVALPQDRLRTAAFVGDAAPRTASLRSSIAGGIAVVAGAVILSSVLSGPNMRYGVIAFGLAIVLLSLVLVTGYGGMVSLCQVSFFGLGCYAMAHFGKGGNLFGVVVGIALSAAVGAVVALPTLRLRGLYLALATFAFAEVMEVAVFGQLIGTGGVFEVSRIKIPGIPTQSDRQYFIFSGVLFAVCAIGVLALRRSPFGRRLVASNDSPAACATLGVSVNATKLIVFTLGAGLAGLGGIVAGGAPGQVSLNDLVALLSLVVLLLARVGGVNTATGALFGAFTYAMYPVIDQHFPKIGAAQYLFTGLAAISVGRDPNGFGGRVAKIAEQLRGLRENSRPSGGDAPQRVDVSGTAAAAIIAEEGETLVGASS